MKVSYPKELDRFIHNCHECEFLGRVELPKGLDPQLFGVHQTYDLYVHRISACRDPRVRDLGWVFTTRYGDSKELYETVVIFANESKRFLMQHLEKPLIRIAWEMATDAGVLDISGVLQEAV